MFTKGGNVNAKIGQHLTLLGLGAMIFYGFMLATGHLTAEILPQFLVSAVIFLSSGRIMRKAASLMGKAEEEDTVIKPQQPQADWPWMTSLLNWTGAFIIIGVMALLLLKPIGLTWRDALSLTTAPNHFFAGAVP